MSQYLSGNYFCLTDKGRVRSDNEDYVDAVVNPWGNVLLVVADGMGGENKGEYASSTLVKEIINTFLSLDKEFKKSAAVKKWIYKTVKAANDKIYLKAQKECVFRGMGTTLSMCLIIKDTLFTAQVGDSRIYLLKDNKLEQISVYQTYVNYLINTKKMDPSVANTHPERHKLTNAVGTKEILNVDIQEYRYNKERILLCTDGLYNNVPLKDLSSIMKGNDSLDKKCMQLIAFGNANGGSDNMALIIWESDD